MLSTLVDQAAESHMLALPPRRRQRQKKPCMESQIEKKAPRGKPKPKANAKAKAKGAPKKEQQTSGVNVENEGMEFEKNGSEIENTDVLMIDVDVDVVAQVTTDPWVGVVILHGEPCRYCLFPACNC